MCTSSAKSSVLACLSISFGRPITFEDLQLNCFRPTSQSSRAGWYFVALSVSPFPAASAQLLWLSWQLNIDIYSVYTLVGLED